MNKLILDKDKIILDYIQIKSLKNLQKNMDMIVEH